MNFGETPKDINTAEKEHLNKLADELEVLRQEFIKKRKLEVDSFPYINWIIQDLRKGDLATAKINYEQQRDKYSDKPEIERFLKDNGIAEEPINWKAWHNSDSYEDYLDQKGKTRQDEFIATRHSLSGYKLNEGIIQSDNPEATPSADKQWFNSDLTPEGIKLAQEKAQEFFNHLNPETDALFFVSSDLVRAAETAKIYLDIARERGFEIILPREKKENKKGEFGYRNKAEEIGEGCIRKIDSLTLDHLDNMLREFIFHSDDYLKKVKDLDKVSSETKEKWAKARQIIENDNRGTWGKNYAAHSEEIAKIFPNVKSAKQVYDSKFKDMMRLVKFGQEKINQQNPEKNIKIMAFSHENSFLYFLNKNFGESMKNCESISFQITPENGQNKIWATTKGQTKEVKE